LPWRRMPRLLLLLNAVRAFPVVGAVAVRLEDLLAEEIPALVIEVARVADEPEETLELLGALLPLLAMDHVVVGLLLRVERDAPLLLGALEVRLHVGALA